MLLASYFSLGPEELADGNLEVMRAPVGSEAWAQRYIADRAQATVQVYDALATLDQSEGDGAHTQRGSR